MNFVEFRTAVIEALQKMLPECLIEPADVLKNNCTVRGVTIKTAGINIAPTIYLEEAFKKYETGDITIDETTEQIGAIYERAKMTQSLDVDFLDNWDEVKTLIFPKAIKTEGNEEYLADTPHTDVLDLSVTYGIKMPSDSPVSVGGIASAKVTQSFLDKWGITLEELHAVAVENIKNEAVFESLDVVMLRMMTGADIPVDNLFDSEEMERVAGGMYVLTNRDKINGGAFIADNDTLARVGEVLDSDYVIIPSSVHEILIIPTSAGIAPDTNTLAEMIGDVNGTQLEAQDVLSDHPYLFVRDEGLKIA